MKINISKHIQHLVRCVQHCEKRQKPNTFPYIVYLNPHINSVRWVQLSSPLYRWRSWGTDRLRKLVLVEGRLDFDLRVDLNVGLHGLL